MHNIDRTQLETSETAPETGSYEFEGGSFYEGPFNEVEEMELASGLLEITSEEELDQFLGDLHANLAGGPETSKLDGQAFCQLRVLREGDCDVRIVARVCS